MNQPRKLIIIDEYFTQRTGHYYEYNKAVQEIFRRKGWQTKIYANRALQPEIVAELDAVPYFHGLTKNNTLSRLPVIGNMLNRVIFWRRLYVSLRKLLKEHRDSDTIFFFTTVLWFNVLPVAISIRKENAPAILLYRVSTHSHIGLPAAFSGLADKIYDYTFRILSDCRKVLFTTDSEVIASELSEITKRAVPVLPIPHLNFEQADIQILHSSKKGSKIRCYAPGAIREEKGIYFILASLEHLVLTDPALLQRITLVTQYGSGSDALNNDVKTRLSKLPLENIFLGNLDSAAYNRELANADIILIPYDINQGYKERTSGIMSEAISFEKPFITSKESWMEIQAINYDTGIAVAYNNAAAFCLALKDVATQIELYREKARKAKPKWIAFHSKDNFYRVLNNAIAHH